MSRKRRKLLVTGGAGFIGANFLHYWRRAHPDDRVVALDALTYAGNLQNLTALKGTPGFSFVLGDIRDPSLVEATMERAEIDTIVHFAAESHVDRSITGPDPFLETNIVGTHVLLKAARKVWLDRKHPGPIRFHHVSTDEVFGALGPDDPPFNEKTPYAPNSPYAASKAASDHLVRAYGKTYGLPVTTSHCSNNYGPYQFPEKLIPLMLVNALTGKPLPVYGDGGNVRDWVHVEDHNRALEAILLQGREGEVYNIGGNNEWRNMDLVERLCDRLDALFTADDTLGKRFPRAPFVRGRACRDMITMVPDRLGHDWRYAVDAGKLQVELGVSPRFDFDAGLDATIRWYVDHEPWWRAVQDGSYRQVRSFI